MAHQDSCSLWTRVERTTLEDVCGSVPICRLPVDPLPFFAFFFFSFCVAEWLAGVVLDSEKTRALERRLLPSVCEVGRPAKRGRTSGLA